MLDNLRKRAALAIFPKKSSGSLDVLATQSPDIPVYTELSVRKATREGYKISGSVYRAVRVVVQAASGIPWVVLDKDGEIIPDHDFTRAWSHPNKEFSGQDNMELIIAHLKLVGNAFIQPIIVNGKPVEFWVCMPDLIRPVPSKVKGEWLAGYQVTPIEGGSYMVPPEQFIHFMQFDPGNPYWGMGDLMAAARTVDTDNEALDTQKISMQNRGITDGVFEAEKLTPAQREESERVITERYLDKSKRRRPWIVAGMKWTQMSMTPVEMDFIESRLQNKRDIAGIFGVDPWFLGDNEHSSYNNILEAKKALYEEAVIPLMDDIRAMLNLKVAPLYGNDITISYDTSKVIALREDYTKKAEQAKTFWGMGVPFSQINERLELGFEEFPGWENGYLPFTLAPVGSAPPEEEEPKMMTKTLNLETEKQKAAHWKRIDRRRVAWWGVVSRKVKPLYDDEIKAIEKAIKGKKPGELELAAGKAIKDGREEWEKTLTAISAALIEDFGNEIADDLGAEKSANPTEAKWVFDPMSAAARTWIIKNSAESITTILATNLDDVKRIILAGTDENLSTVKISRNLRQFYTDHSPFKAMRVARTEVSHAAGFGQREAARQSGVVQTKSWISSRDDRVRDEHIAMDTDENHNVPLNKRYSDGSMYPGEQDIMCRCVESYQTGG